MKADFIHTEIKSEFKEYEVLLATIPGGVVVTKADDEFTILFANQEYYNLVGYEKEEHYNKFNNIGIKTLHPEQTTNATKMAKEQLVKSGAFSVKAKLSHKNKDYIWAHFSGRLFVDSNGEHQIYIVIVYITEHILLAEQFEREHNFNNLISLLTDDGFFDCDITNKTIRYSKNFADKLGLPETVVSYPESLFDKGIITKDSMHYYTNRFINRNTDAVIEEEINFIAADGSEVWYLYHYHIIYDQNNMPVRAVGKMTNITEQHHKLEELTQKANRDQLTCLYNKTATELLIKEALKQRCFNDDNYALLIIDIDNFKNINDKLGHLYGDIVLTQLASSLKPLFRTDDIVGRVGGDEFFVFIKKYKSVEVIKTKAKEICRAFRKTYSDGHITVSISASIGIALCPEHGSEFDELYKSADTALYNAKAIGKNQFFFFDKKTVNTYQSPRTEIDTQGYIQKNFQENTLEYIFKLLYSAKNPKASVKSVLRLLTEHFGFSRGYIFETSADGRFSSNTFEWYLESTTPQKDNLQNLPIEVLKDVNDSFCKTGMYVLENLNDISKLSQNILKPQDIKSMFLFGIMKDKKPIGFIGFDDCINERVPTKDAMDEICTNCQVLATFLLKQRSSEQEQQRSTAIETILNKMNNLSYVIDYQTYDVLFENEKVSTFTGKSAIGSKCYNTFRAFDRPCLDCPMAKLSDTINQYTDEIYNQKYDIYLLTDATWITWTGNKKACLITNFDITKHKKQLLKTNDNK